MGCVMIALPENKYGYLCLYEPEENRGVYIKANTISSISPVTDALKDEDIKTIISTNYQNVFYVGETIDQILEQLENIHPSML